MCRASNFQFEPWQFRPRAKPQNPKDSAPPTTPTNFCSRRYATQAKIARKRFLLWEIGFPDAKISTRARRARRFCRFSKSSKSVGLGRLENPLGFQPSRRRRFYCERASALSRSPGFGRFFLAWGPSRCLASQIQPVISPFKGELAVKRHRLGGHEAKVELLQQPSRGKVVERRPRRKDLRARRMYSRTA